MFSLVLKNLAKMHPLTESHMFALNKILFSHFYELPLHILKEYHQHIIFLFYYLKYNFFVFCLRLITNA